MPGHADSPPPGYKPYPWPWAHESILTLAKPDPTWLDTDWTEEDDSSDYIPEEHSGSDDSGNDSDSDDEYISDSEIAALGHYPLEWRHQRWPTHFQEAQEEIDDLPRQITRLVIEERAAAAAYDPGEVVTLLTQFLELLIEMGHYPENSLRYAPHTEPSVNVELATELGYSESAVHLMQQLPYFNKSVNGSREEGIVARTRFADYTSDRDLREGRRPYPYQFYPQSGDLDPWLLPLVLPGRDGWHVIIDTKLGVVRSYDYEGLRHRQSVEWRRHGPLVDDEEQYASEASRAPLVRAAHFFSQLIVAYRSLSRLPVIGADHNDPWMKERHGSGSPNWFAIEIKAEQDTLLSLYCECGWPDNWRRAEFMAKWKDAHRDIQQRTRELLANSEQSDSES
ncbi:hypothetical protein FB45DRAFT_132224 [Roridomyces roridus]|uniref:Uncharacterized protein n=1 Tax=Roridomyces roridus TaxID=1738132 RepID=A0AAD7BHF7_9AGAR|nr:hypothetical protein FB45DRAFT_132224 [Roridomyces roridus]